MKRLGIRLVTLVLVVFASSALAFVFLELAPGDFLSDAQLHPQISEAALRDLRSRYGLDQPVIEKYATWLASVARGDWGQSFARGLPVFPLVTERGVRTLLLAGAAQVIAWILALLLAWAAVQRPGGWVDRIAQIVNRLLLSLPEIVIALLVILGLTRWGGAVSPATAALLALVVAVTPALAAQTRAALLRASAEPFVDAARSRALPRRLLFTRYLLPAAAPALLSLAGLSVGGLLSSSLLIECVTAYPGLGPLLLEAVFARDALVVVGAVFLSTILWAAASFLADLAQWSSDPRLREPR